MKTPLKEAPQKRTYTIHPPGWGDDSLSGFIESAYRNRLATFVKKQLAFKKLAEIDSFFMIVTKDWLNPPNLITPMLLTRSHAAFRAACEHATAGQAADTCPVIRTCLEYAGYALHLHKNPTLSEIWLKRHENEASFRAAKNEFRAVKIKTTIENTDRHIGATYNRLYEWLINFGAHPNERSVTGNMSLTEAKDKKIYLQIYLHKDGPPLDNALKTTIEAGICALEILQEVFKARFELLGVKEKLLNFKRNNKL